MYVCIHAVGDAGNEVLTTSELAKLKFDPNLYRVNAYQGLVYDPMRKSNHCRQTHAAILQCCIHIYASGTVPVDVDLRGKLRAEKERGRHAQVQQSRQRRMSDSAVSIVV